MCLMFLFLGRFWCAICPFTKVSELVQKLWGLRLNVPPFLKEYGLVIIMIAFLELTWLEEVFHIAKSPRATAVMLLIIFTGAVGMGLFFQRKSWCRYVCPLGALAAVYSKASLFKLRSDESLCSACQTRDCVQGTATSEPCPVFETPFNLESASFCVLCGNCAKNCPHDSISLRFEGLSRDMFSWDSLPMEIVALIIMLGGVVTFLNGLDSNLWGIEDWLKTTWSPTLSFTLIFIVSLFLAWYLFKYAAKLSVTFAGGSVSDIIKSMSLPLIPLILLTHTGHAGSELLKDGAELMESLFKMAGTTGPAWLISAWSGPAEKMLSPVLIFLGLIFSLVVLTRTVRMLPMEKKALACLPFAVYFIVLAGLNFWFTMI